MSTVITKVLIQRYELKISVLIHIESDIKQYITDMNS